MMNSAKAKRIVAFIRRQPRVGRDFKDLLVDKYEIGYDEAVLLLLLAKTDWAR
jgi:hypothetical protein